MTDALVGFFSYARRDNEAHGRQLSAVREFLSAEVQTLLGRPFQLFQDIEHSARGQRWEPQILEALQQADVLVPVISPAFFASEWCRREVTTFMESKRELAGGPAVFPLYFVTVDEIEHGVAADDLVSAVRQFDFEDIREFRIPPRARGVDDIAPLLAMRLQRLSNSIKQYGSVEKREQLPLRPVAPPDEPLHFQVVLRADDERTRREALTRVIELLEVRGYPEPDLGAAATTFRELCDNVTRHVGREAELRAVMGEIEKDWPHHHAGFYLEVADSGPGFDLTEKLRLDDLELSQGGREHGLLRALRLGMIGNSLDPHCVAWFRELTPHIGVSAFSTEQVVPVVFSWAHEAIRINHNVVTFQQWEQYRPYDRWGPAQTSRRSDTFMDLVFDPLLRPGQEVVGIEVIGQGWTGCLPCTELLREVHAFIGRSNSHLRTAVVYADGDASDQRSIREFTREVDWTFFETIDRARAFRNGGRGASTT